jgi:DNA-binding response OmpR family regulator
VLLVDDNAEGTRALARVLGLMGYDVTAVVDGTTALEILERNPPPQFLLIDLRLPDLDGREVARFATQLVPRPYVILVTGWDREEDLIDIARWGIDHLFLKPVLIDVLLAKLNEVNASSARPDASAGRSNLADPAKDI